MPSNTLKIDSFSTEEIRNLIFDNSDYKKGMKLFAAYLVSKGWSARKISKLMDVSFKQVTLWIHSINEEGLEGLEEKPRTGRKSQLDEQQKAELKSIILNYIPKDYKIDDDRWKGDSVRQLIDKYFKVDYKPAQVYNIINSLKLKYENGKWRSTD